MKRILHLCWGLEPTNGAANVARMFIKEQQFAGDEAELASKWTADELRSTDELWCHCGWYWRIWLSVALAKHYGKRVVWLPAGCYDPLRLAYSAWKKRLVGPFERWALRHADLILATCNAEADWIRAYEPRVKCVEVTDLKRFFHFDFAACSAKLAELRRRFSTS